MASARHRMLTEHVVGAMTKAGTYNDGEGLTLRVSETGHKQWVMRAPINGRQRNIGLGTYPSVGPEEARERAQEIRKAIRQGRDPIRERRVAREQAKEQQLIPTFREASASFIESMTPTWRTLNSRRHWESSLSNHVCPAIGDKPMNEVTSGDVVNVLAPIWLEKEETAKRVLQRIERIFDHAIIMGWRQDNPAGKHIKLALPRQVHRRERHAVLPYQEIPNAVAAIRDSSSDRTTKLAFEFMVLCVAGSRETRSAEWNDISLDNRVWTIPAFKAKTDGKHRIPLSDRAVDVLTGARDLTNGDGLVFPSIRSIQAGEPNPLSDSAFSTLWRRMELPGVPHGIRSSFMTWALYEHGHQRIVMESALGHTRNIGTLDSLTIWSASHAEAIRRLLQAWGHYVTTGENLPFERE